jgi:hypothetical protein
MTMFRLLESVRVRASAGCYLGGGGLTTGVGAPSPTREDICLIRLALFKFR